MLPDAYSGKIYFKSNSVVWMLGKNLDLQRNKPFVTKKVFDTLNL